MASVYSILIFLVIVLKLFSAPPLLIDSRPEFSPSNSVFDISPVKSVTIGEKSSNTFTEKIGSLINHSSQVNDIAFSPGGKIFVSCSDQSMILKFGALLVRVVLSCWVSRKTKSCHKR